MDMGERIRNADAPAGPQEPAPPTSGGLAQIRSRADDLLAASRDAIRQVLSHDSEAFLKVNRQHGAE